MSLVEPNRDPVQPGISGESVVVIAAGGHTGIGTKRGDHVVAFTLP